MSTYTNTLFYVKPIHYTNSHTCHDLLYELKCNNQTEIYIVLIERLNHIRTFRIFINFEHWTLIVDIYIYQCMYSEIGGITLS